MKISKRITILLFTLCTLVAEATDVHKVTAEDFPYDKDVISFESGQHTYYAVISEVRRSDEKRVELEKKLILKAKGNLVRFITNGDANLSVTFSQFTPYKFWQSEQLASMICTVKKNNVSVKKSNKKKQTIDIESIIKNTQLLDGVQFLKNGEDTYLVAKSEAEYDSASPQSRVNAIRKIKTITESELSKLINGTKVSTQETLESTRIVSIKEGKASVLKDQTVYSNFISSKSSGAIKNVKSLIWKDDSVYYGASYIIIK